MLVSDLVNVRYLSGFTGSNAALLIRADDETPVLATDGRYRTQAAQQVSGRRDRHRAGVWTASGRPRRRRRCAALGLRKPRRDRRRVRRARARRPAKVELVRAAGTVEALREVKDAGEVALLRLACEAADAALADLVERGGLRPGRTEKRGRPRAGVVDAGPRRRRRCRSRPSSRPAPTRRSHTTGPPTPCWRPATSSRSTSAPWCAATTRT